MQSWTFRMYIGFHYCCLHQVQWCSFISLENSVKVTCISYPSCEELGPQLCELCRLSKYLIRRSTAPEWKFSEKRLINFPDSFSSCNQDPATMLFSDEFLESYFLTVMSVIEIHNVASQCSCWRTAHPGVAIIGLSNWRLCCKWEAYHTWWFALISSGFVYRKSGTYENWGLHLWGDAKVATSWESPLSPTGSDDYGVYWEVDAKSEGNLHFQIHQGEAKVSHHLSFFCSSQWGSLMIGD